MPRCSSVKPNTYQDSVRLMRVSQKVAGQDQVRQASVAMGTEANKRMLAESGLLTDQVRGARANDLVIVVEAETDEAARSAVELAGRLLLERRQAAGSGGATQVAPRFQEQARGLLPGANLMLISVPGAYAALEAAKALQAGLHVFLFSDNVTLEAEVALKKLAVARGLLMMGPGCGTAHINGVGLGFANVLKRGPVGIVAASGTGLQELTALIDRGGVGISQAIGVGGRDLSESVGGLMTLQGLAMLAGDPVTSVIALISKPPHPTATPKILEAARATGKPVVVNFLGGAQGDAHDGLQFTHTIEDTAEAVLRQVTGGGHSTYALGAPEFQHLVARERVRLAPGQRYARGLFSGGSLCDEAMDIMRLRLGDIYSNVALAPEWALPSGWQSQGHCCLDLGEEEFTRGRPHPMIDVRLRQDRLLKEADDPEVAVILLDVVIGFGSHDDPAGALAATIQAAKAKAAAAGRHLVVVAHVCGTVQDPQGLEDQEGKLRQAGALVLPTNAQAAKVAAAIVA
jgi:FdrA protein